MEKLGVFQVGSRADIISSMHGSEEMIYCLNPIHRKTLSSAVKEKRTVSDKDIITESDMKVDKDIAYIFIVEDEDIYEDFDIGWTYVEKHRNNEEKEFLRMLVIEQHNSKRNVGMAFNMFRKIVDKDKNRFCMYEI